MPSRSFDVAIIGGGVAGLSCAKTLVEALGSDARVVVLEASERPGGRIKTASSAVSLEDAVEPFAGACATSSSVSSRNSLRSQCIVELGAEIVHGEETSIAKIVKETLSEDCLREFFVVSQGDGGPSEAPAPDGGIGYYYLGKEKRLFRYDECDGDMQHLHDVLHSMGDRDALLARGEKRAELGSLRDFLAREGVRGRVMGLAEAGYANTTSGTLDSISAAMICYAERMWESDGDADHFLRPPASMSDIVDTLSNGIDVRTNHAVSSIEWGGKQVALSVRGNDSIIECNACVVAVPISMLKRDAHPYEGIAFSPSLPQEKRDAVEAIEFGNACKIHCRFSSLPWPENCHGIVCADCRIPEIWMSANDGAFFATGYLMATAADNLRGMTAKDACLVLAEQLDEIFSRGAIDSFVEGLLMDWSQVPFVRGAYTRPGLKEIVEIGERGAYPLSRQRLALPVKDKLFFAGEATNVVNFMTAHGAIDSGKRAAQEVLASALMPTRSKY